MKNARTYVRLFGLHISVQDGQEDMPFIAIRIAFCFAARNKTVNLPV